MSSNEKSRVENKSNLTRVQIADFKKGNNGILQEEEVKELISKYSNIPVNQLNSDEISDIVDLIRAFPNHNMKSTASIFSATIEFKASKYTVNIDSLKNNLYFSIIKPKRKPAKRRLKKPVMKDFASCPTSLIGENLTKNCKPSSIDHGEDLIVSEDINTKAGIINFAKKTENKINPILPDSKILKDYKDIGFKREELQIYLALLNVYIQNTRKKDYGKSCEIEVPFFHNEILKRKDHIRKEDLQKYESIFVKLAMKRIIYCPEGANCKPYTKKEFKDLKINSSLINIDITTALENKHQIIRIAPSAYMLLELKMIKQISNYLPWDFLQLNFDDSEATNNIFYFGLFFVRMHRNNASHIVDKKRIYNKKYAWEIDFKELVINALNGEELIKEYEKAREKKKFIRRNIENSLIKTIKILEDRNYILKQKQKRININYRNAFEENKIKFIFNYDNGKLITLE